MTEKTSPDPIQVLLAEAQRNVGVIPKDSKNTAQGFSFRGIDQVMAACHEEFARLGIVVLPEVLEATHHFEERESNNRVVLWERCNLRIRFTFVGPAGDTLSAISYGTGLDQSDKASNKAFSGALKYCLTTITTAPTSDMADSDRHNPEVAGTRPGAAQRRAPAAYTWANAWREFAQMNFKGKQQAALKELVWPDGTAFDEVTAETVKLLITDLQENDRFAGVTRLEDAIRVVEAAMMVTYDLLHDEDEGDEDEGDEE